MAQNNTSNLVRGYSRAIFAIANEFGITEQFSLLLQFLQQIIKHPSVKKILINGTISYLDKADLLIKIINSHQKLTDLGSHNMLIAEQSANDSTTKKEFDFLQFLAKKKHLLLIPSIYEQYDKIYLENQKKLRITIISAIILNDMQQQTLQHSLTKHFNKEILSTFQVDKSIIAGILIKYNDEIIDYSLKSKLLSLSQSLKNN